MYEVRNNFFLKSLVPGNIGKLYLCYVCIHMKTNRNQPAIIKLSFPSIYISNFGKLVTSSVWNLYYGDVGGPQSHLPSLVLVTFQPLLLSFLFPNYQTIYSILQ